MVYTTDYHQSSSSSSPVRNTVRYNVYKGKSALNIKPIPPTFAPPSPKGYRTIEREGTLFLEVAPAGSQPREYDWSRKITFALSATECGELLANHDFSQTVEFMHDPGAGGTGVNYYYDAVESSSYL